MLPHHLQRLSAISAAFAGVFLLLGLLTLLRPPAITHAQEQPEALGTLSGVVRNGQGDPLPNITVSLEHYEHHYPPRSATSDGSGAYQFASVMPGIYTLKFEDEAEIYAPTYYGDADFASDGENVVVSGNNVTGVDVELRIGGAISITLQNRQGITTATYSVTLYRQNLNGSWAQYRSASSRVSEGGISVNALPSGSYRLCAGAHNIAGYFIIIECYDNILPEPYYQLPPNASDIHVQAGVETAVAIMLDDITQFEGVILSPDNQPLADIPISARRHDDSISNEVWTDENGYFRFGYLHAGSYEVTINYYGSNSYLPLYYSQLFSGGSVPPLVIDSSTRLSITQQLTLEARIIGKVTLPNDVPLTHAITHLYLQLPDGSWGELTNCPLHCLGIGYDATTGVYTRTKLIAGRYRIAAEYTIPGSSNQLIGYYGGTSLESADDIVLGTGETKTNINITLGAGDFDSTITGIVTANGEPREGVEVGLFTQVNNSVDSRMPFVATTTDAQGRYSLSGLALGSYLVGARDPEGVYAITYYTQPNSPIPDIANLVIVTKTGTINNINIALSPGGTIRGYLRTEKGNAPGGYSIQVIPPTFDPYYTIPLPFLDVRSDANGFFELASLPPGSYFLRAKIFTENPQYPSTIYLYYPGVYDVSVALPLTVGAGETLEGIFLFTEPDMFLPMIDYADPTVESRPASR